VLQPWFRQRLGLLKIGTLVLSVSDTPVFDLGGGGLVR